jgi:hypothetical protein
VGWTGPEAGEGSTASDVDRDYASGLVSSLVISIVRRTTGGGQSAFHDLVKAQAERRRRRHAWPEASAGVLGRSEMYDVGVRPSYGRSVSSIFALRPEWCSAEERPPIGADGVTRFE